MSLKKFDGVSWLLGLLSGSVIIFLGKNYFFMGLPCVFQKQGSFFCFDFLTLCLGLLSVVLGLSLVFWLDCFSGVSKVMIFLSVLCSLLSYCCVHSLGFWVFYEVSILSLLCLLVLESPYSERFIAAWYLLGYVVLTSLPMLLCLLCLSLELGSFSLCFWDAPTSLKVSVVVLLAVLFITKIPLYPFHVWLPMVHAEASSPVSVCLSGYVMKLGLLGVFRFCSWLLPDYIFSLPYVGGGLLLTMLFFFSACRELDSKRWLAFLSLSHIVVPVVCVSVVGCEGLGVSFLYCLGHGLSAGGTFLVLWVFYEISGSRNWVILKNCFSSNMFLRLLGGGCLCTVASLPPTVQFFSEISILIEGGSLSGIFIFGFFCYLFLGGLVPVSLLGYLFTSHYSMSFSGGCVFMGTLSVLLLLMWGGLLFLVI